jgi:hypothetical protein
MHAEADVQAFLKAWQDVMSMVASGEIEGDTLIGEVKVKRSTRH